MLPQHVLVALASVISVSALPLNINLGAYSPALVVGDGEISFGGSTERASQVLQTLATGAQNGATGAGTGGGIVGGAGAEGARAPAPAAAAPLGAAPIIPAGQPAAAEGAGIATPLVAPAAPAGGVRPETNANAAEVVQSSLSPPEFISHKIGGGFDPARKYPNLMKRDGLSDLVERGNAIAGNEVAKRQIKRDIEGFRQALTFASDALRNGPRVELGTENAGIGILQNAGSAVPVGSAANGARAPGAVERRAVPEQENKLGVTLLAIAEI